jgi:hypothetical protein
MDNNEWANIEIMFLVKNCSLITDTEIAQQLSRMTGKTFERGDCVNMRNMLGLKKTRGKQSVLTDDGKKALDEFELDKSTKIS